MYAELEDDGTTPSPEEGEGPVVEKETPPVQELAADSAPVPAPEPTPDEQGEGNQAEDWQQKYQTLQGMYNADVPRLTAQNQELAGRITQMEQLIATMQVAQPVPTPEPQTTLTAEEVDEYGESIDIMRKVSEEAAGSVRQQLTELQQTVRQMQGAVLPRVEQIASQQAQTVEQNFWADLTNLVPNWRDINGNEDFQNWLLETDPLSGLTRQTYLDDAQRIMDPSRVASFFESWLQLSGTATAQPNRTAATSELEKQVTPGRSRNTGAPQGKEQKTYTPRDITKFFADVRTGKFKGKEEERDKIERDIFAAQREGRIVNA